MARLFAIAVDSQVLMGAALIVVHVGAVMVRRASSDAARHRRALLSYGLALLLIMIGIPWWRPLLRL